MMSLLSNQAEEILKLNWKNGFTIPTSTLYPFQWNWDSGFTSLGLSISRVEDVILELRSLFEGQWDNGMLPHIVFHDENVKTYFPNHDFWRCEVNAGAPKRKKTSGITNPPVIGFVLEKLLERHPDNDDLVAFVKELYPKVLSFHEFLYSSRDPFHEGLIYAFHPWETGRDNSPVWDESMDRIEIDRNLLSSYERKDLDISNADHRPTNDQYDRFVYLVDFGRQHQYDSPLIAQDSPFLVQDSMMNAILVKSNDALIRIGKKLNFDTKKLEEWQTQSIKSFHEKLWNEELGVYVSYDLRVNKQIQMKEVGGFTSFFGTDVNEEKAKRMNAYLISLHDRGYFLCPSFDVDHKKYDSKRYWRGPIWPQMNWMLYQGLRKHGLNETAEIVKSDLLTLVNKLGFYEYFEPSMKIVEDLEEGYGAQNFSWTAASVLDLIS